MDRNDLEIVVIVLILAPLGATLSVALISGVARYLQGIPRWRKYVLLFKRWGEMWITILASAISFVCTLLLFNIEEPLKFTLLIPIYVDALSVYFVLMVNIIALVASFYIGHYLDFVRQHRHLLGTDMPSGEEESTRLGRFHLFFNFFHLTMVLVPLMDNLVLLWIAVELTTVASAFLVGFRHDRQALEAAWKYTVITSTGVIFALLGTLFLANAIPDITSMEWSTLNEHLSMSHAQTNNPFIILSFLFVLIGYGTKAGFAPMHTWLPDGHGEAPYPVSALLSGVLLKSALYAILRFYILSVKALSEQPTLISHILLASGLFSLGVATPFILKRNKFKRILAYHSLEHMGIITFGLGIGTKIALFAALLHALNHALTKALMFLAFGLVQSAYAPVARLEEEKYTGLLRAMPFTGILIVLGGLALVGSPPFNIFFSEMLILWAAVQKAQHAPLIWAAIFVFLLSVALIFAGLVRHLGHLLLGNPPRKRIQEPAWLLWPLFFLFLSVLLFGITVPDWDILNLAHLLNSSVDILISGGP